MSDAHCKLCLQPISAGQRFCHRCHYPGIEDDWAEYLVLVEDGHSRYQAKVMAGLIDPDEAKEN